MKIDLSKYNKISIIGAARSGIAAAKLFHAKAFNVLLSESVTEDKVNKGNLDEIKSLGIEYEFGEHTDKVFDCDLMVVSPGVPQDSEVIKKALNKGIDVVSEVESSSWFCKGKIIAITGTNGKTTTTTLIGEILKDAGLNAYACGNIGLAFADVASKINKDDIAVVETSSFQLDNIKYFKPNTSILLNITPDHLDRYENNYDKYIESKLNVFKNQDSNDFFIYNTDDEVIVKNIEGKVKANSIPISVNKNLSGASNNSAYLDNGYLMYSENGNADEIVHSSELIIKGQHNIYNALASISTAKIFSVDNTSIKQTLTNFNGVEHRLEFVRELNGVKFYNDSKATNVNSVWYALQGFSEPIVLILGGKDKGNNYDEIKNEVKKYVKHIVAIGSSQEKVYDYFKDIVATEKADDMKDAVKKCVNASKKGDVILLSPACASFDMFTGFEHRGQVYKETVNSL